MAVYTEACIESQLTGVNWHLHVYNVLLIKQMLTRVLLLILQLANHCNIALNKEMLRLQHLLGKFEGKFQLHQY